MRSRRKFPIGAEVITGKGVDFRVWAPRSGSAAVELLSASNDAALVEPLQAEDNAYSSGTVAAARAGMLYHIKLDHGSFPDPASRCQPDGPHGPSQIVDSAFRW